MFPHSFSNRSIQPELLDHLPPEKARPNLADLVRINKKFGGHSVIRKVLAQVIIEHGAFTLLDVGAASGDTARLIQELYPAASITNLDCNLTNLEAAPQPKLIANAFELPFPERSFDYVLCSLFLHHFSNEQVISLLRSLHSLARRALLVSDLERHLVPYCFLLFTKPLLGWNDVTVHDGCISVRAGFHCRELQELSRAAGIENAIIEAHRPAFRISLIAAK